MQLSYVMLRLRLLAWCLALISRSSKSDRDAAKHQSLGRPCMRRGRDNEKVVVATVIERAQVCSRVLQNGNVEVEGEPVSAGVRKPTDE